jgi:hypothetical protein
LKALRKHLRRGLNLWSQAVVRWADRENRFFYCGLLLLGIGLGYRAGWDVAAIVIGVILILAVNPIYGWWRDGRAE